jgi:pimeloyl-ACP methyl ester carboxylesterase
MVNFTKETIIVKGCKVSVQRGGTGEPMLYLHGGGVVNSVQPFMELLGQDFDLIVPQHPGFGESEFPEWLEGMADMAFFYQEFIGHLGLTDVHLVGTSIGGWMAASIAVRGTQNIKTLTLAAPGGLDDPGIPKGEPFKWTALETLRNVIYDQKLAEAIIAKLPPDPDTNPGMIKNRKTSKILAGPDRRDPVMQKWLHLIKVPTHIIWGEHDKLMPVAYAAEFQKRIEGSTLEIFTECGHLPYTEKAADYARSITDHVRKHA